MLPHRLLATMAAAGLALALHAGPAATQAFPAKPVRMVIGLAAGGTTDLVGRIVAQRLVDVWGQTVVVENRTGASGMIAAEAVAKAPADGYTLLVTPQSSLVVAPMLYGKAAYEAARDFTPITLIGSTPTIMVVNPAFPPKSFSEFAELARKSTPPLAYGSGGIGSSPHMAGELLSAQLGIRMTHIPYKGESPALTDTMGGQVPIMFGNISVAVPLIKSVKLRAIASTGAARSPLLPDVPTVAESGLKDFAVASWFGLLGPAGMPQAVIDKLHAALKKALTVESVRERYRGMGVEIMDMTQADFAAYVRADYEKWRSVARDANIVVE